MHYKCDESCYEYMHFETMLNCFDFSSRNYGMGDTECVLDMKPLKHQNCEFTITVGKHTATVWGFLFLTFLFFLLFLCL